MKIAVLFAASDGSYIGVPGLVPWTEDYDARLYRGTYPVIAHPPCERWGRYWSGGPSANERRALGDDNGCFEAAFLAVNQYGGVVEHPEASHAWKAFGIKRPDPNGGWTQMGPRQWVCQVEQGHYGHPARKKTWLYYVGDAKPFDLIWGESKGIRLDEGFHSKEERKRARAAGIKPVKRLSKKQCIHTPPAFRDVLIKLAQLSRYDCEQKGTK